MGSLFESKVPSVPPPPEPKDYNVDDRIGGTKQTIVNQPDGSKLVVIEKNLTPEQQEIEDNLKRLAEESLGKYEALVNDPFLDTIPEYKAQVDQIFGTQMKSLNDAYRGAARDTEKTASRFGTEDSTAAALTRAQNAKDLAGAKQQLTDDKIGLTNSIRQQEMQNQLGLYGLASGRQDTLLTQGVQTLGLGNSIAMQNAARDDTYQTNLYNTRAQLAQAQANARSAGLGTFGTILGLGVGGFAGSALGSKAILGLGGKIKSLGSRAIGGLL